MFFIGLQAMLSHWRKNPLQWVTLVFGVAFATALWTGIQAINSEARASYDRAEQQISIAQFDQIQKKDKSSIPHEEFILLRRAGWMVSPIIRKEFPDAPDIEFLGVDPVSYPGFNLAAPEASGVPLESIDANIAFANTATLARLKTHGGFEIRELSTVPDGVVVTDLANVVSIRTEKTHYSALLVSNFTPKWQRPLAEVAKDLILINRAEFATDLGRLTDSFHLNLTAFGLLAFAVGIFIVYGAVGLAFEQRRPVVRTLRALGYPLKKLLWVIATELMVFAIFAGAIGVLLGYFLAAALLPDVSSALGGLYGADVPNTLRIRSEWWMTGMAIAVLGTAIAAASSFFKLAKMPLLSATKNRSWSQFTQRSGIQLACVGALLWVVAICLYVFGSGLITGFAILGGLLIGAAFMLPLFLLGLLTVALRCSRDHLVRWFWADTRQQLSGLSLALMALMLAMATNIGVSTMVNSFRDTFTGWLDQRMSSEMYLRFEDPEMARRTVSYLEGRVDAMLPIIQAKSSIRGELIDLYGIVDHATYRENWGMLDQSETMWDDIANGIGIAVNEQVARKADIKLGDSIEANSKQFTVVAIYGDYGNPIGQAIIGMPAFTAMFPNVTADRFGVRLKPDAIPVLMTDLKTDLGLTDDNMIDQSSIKQSSINIFEQTFAVTAALNVLTLAVAGFAILMSLLTLSAMRLPQMAPAWAMGLTRAKLGRYELLRALSLAGVTCVVAIPLGLALSWVLLSVVNVEAFGWQIPMFLFPATYAKLVLLSLAAAVIAALWPSWVLSRTPPERLLKVFSNEK